MDALDRTPPSSTGEEIFWRYMRNENESKAELRSIMKDKVYKIDRTLKELTDSNDFEPRIPYIMHRVWVTKEGAGFKPMPS